MWGRWRGQKLEHKMPSFQQVPLCMKRERKKEDNEEAIERRAHGLLLESSLSLQVVKQNSVGILVRGVPWGQWAGAAVLQLRISIFILGAGGWGAAVCLLFLVFLWSPWGRRVFSNRVWCFWLFRLKPQVLSKSSFQVPWWWGLQTHPSNLGVRAPHHTHVLRLSTGHLSGQADS